MPLSSMAQINHGSRSIMRFLIPQNGIQIVGHRLPEGFSLWHVRTGESWFFLIPIGQCSGEIGLAAERCQTLIQNNPDIEQCDEKKLRFTNTIMGHHTTWFSGALPRSQNSFFSKRLQKTILNRES